MSNFRHEAVRSLMDRQARTISFPTGETGKPRPLSELFGSRVFGLKQLQHHLPKPVYAAFNAQIAEGKTFDKVTADAIAHAVRVWAQEHGATHYTHWFQPQTNSTAEKHDSFLNLKTSTDGTETIAMDSFSGSALIQAEPDASSFPHGGVRTTFEARGYTVWDPLSPMFLQDGPHGTSILYIPSVFISYNGDALDEKTGLLRSIAAVSKSAVHVLNLLGDTATTKVAVTLGTEQEFFLVDRGLYSHRQDLKISGRTILGQVPPKHQQLEDHYLGNIPSRVLATISEAELELWKLGVPVKTRHNEVAPNQFEMAPIFEDANIAVDHNLLTMEVLHKVAHRHKLKALFHEKPFKGVNGSGKHCNWSMATNTGRNLLDPTSNPETNTEFLVFLVATLLGVYRYGGLLRASIASASNDHRLGASEAPPAIVSVFLGEHLTEVLNSVEEGRAVRASHKPEFKSVKVGGTSLDIKVATLPEITRDLTDRNRTSPFAFTGNKFEFRAVGSKQSPSFPVTLVNSAVSTSLNEIAAAIEAKKGTKSTADKADIMAVLKEYIKITKPIRFEGNNYSNEWAEEASKRGLPNIKSSPEAYQQLLVPAHVKMLTETCSIFTPAELQARYHVLVEKYAKDILIEAKVLRSLINQQVFPAVFKYRRELASGILALEQVKQPAPERSVLTTLSGLVTEAVKRFDELENAYGTTAGISDLEQQAREALSLVPLMRNVRDVVDSLEDYVADELWPLPKYNDMFFA